MTTMIVTQFLILAILLFFAVANAAKPKNKKTETGIMCAHNIEKLIMLSSNKIKVTDVKSALFVNKNVEATGLYNYCKVNKEHLTKTVRQYIKNGKRKEIPFCKNVNFKKIPFKGLCYNCIRKNGEKCCWDSDQACTKMSKMKKNDVKMQPLLPKKDNLPIQIPLKPETIEKDCKQNGTQINISSPCICKTSGAADKQMLMSLNNKIDNLIAFVARNKTPKISSGSRRIRKIKYATPEPTSSPTTTTKTYYTDSMSTSTTEPNIKQKWIAKMEYFEEEKILEICKAPGRHSAKNCTEFYECTSGTNDKNRLILYQCPYGMMFSDGLKTCVEKGDSICDRKDEEIKA